MSLDDDQNLFFPIPFQNAEIFYRAFIGGALTPGAIPPGGVDGWDMVSDWDVKKGKGKKDAVLTDNGDPPPTGKIKYQIWRDGRPDGAGGFEPNDFKDDALFVAMLLKARDDGTALDISHPIVNAARTFSVVAKVIGGLKDAGGGLFTRELEFLKWVEQPKDAGGTPTGSKDSDKNPDGDSDEKEPEDPNAALKKEFQDKVKEAQDAPDT